MSTHLFPHFVKLLSGVWCMSLVAFKVYSKLIREHWKKFHLSLSSINLELRSEQQSMTWQDSRCAPCCMHNCSTLQNSPNCFFPTSVRKPRYDCLLWAQTPLISSFYYEHGKNLRCFAEICILTHSTHWFLSQTESCPFEGIGNLHPSSFLSTECISLGCRLDEAQWNLRSRKESKLEKIAIGCFLFDIYAPFWCEILVLLRLFCCITTAP